MAPRKGKKAAPPQVEAEAVVADSANDAASNGNDIEPEKIVKQAKTTKAVPPPKEKPKKGATSKKNAVEQSEQENGGDDDAENDTKVDVKSSKRAAASKKNAKATEQNDDEDENTAAGKANGQTTNGAAPDDGKKRTARGKQKEDEPIVQVKETKVTKGKLKKIVQETVDDGQNSEPEPEPSKVDKKNQKGKSAKNKVELVEDVEVASVAPVETKSRRGGAKKAVAPEKPVEIEKPAKGKAKTTKASAKATKSKPAAEPIAYNVTEEESQEEEEVVVQPKSRKRGATKSKPAAEPIAYNVTEEESQEEEEVVVQPKSRKRGATKSKLVAEPIAYNVTEEESQEEEEVVVQPKSRKRGATKSKPVAEPITDDVTEEESQEEEEVVVQPKNRNKLAAAPAKKGKKGTAGAAAKAKVTPKKRKADAKTTAADSTTNDSDDDMVTKRKKASKEDNVEEKKVNPTETDFSQINFNSDKEYTLKIVSWNVAGLRALVKKNGLEYFEHEQPDIICLQEIKCMEEQVPEEAKLKGYHPYWCSTPGGRGGVAILSKHMPYSVEQNLDDEEMDKEGRIITAEYSKFYLVCVYVPNSSRQLINLELRMRWNKLFEAHVTALKAKKPVIICGDMNVAHDEIDLANPKTNKKNAGFTQEERDGMTDLLNLGFVDTFRELYPNQDKAYTFWTNLGGARKKNVGWRLDYSIVSDNLKSKVVDSVIRSQVLGSDHCPIVLLMDI